MRRIRKIIGSNRQVPIIKEDTNNTIIKRGDKTDKISRINVRSENIPTLQRRDTRVNIQRNESKIISKVDPIWSGETVYIIGGGPSLVNFDWNQLIGKRTIAINKAIVSYPNADVLYWTDSRIYGWYKNEIDKFKGLKYTIRDHSSYSADSRILRKGNAFGLEESRDSLCHGNNSGYAAINLAYLFGVKKIVLLGYDMHNDGKQSHYHDGYPVPATGDNIYRDQFIPGFKVLADILKEKKVEVYNASMTSSLTVWPKISFEQALTLR
jgi:hypothetical protein